MARPGPKNLVMYSGDGFGLRLRFWRQEEDGTRNARDISTSTWLAQIRRHENADDVLATFVLDLADAANGYLTLSLAGETVSLLYPRAVWDLQETPPSAEPTTKLAGRVIVKQDVSR